MILYHGTSTEYLDTILRDGLQPRRITGQSGNYDREVPSNADFVYLSDAYPAYYATGAVQAENADPAILAVEIDVDDLYPDEDFIAECLCQANKGDWKETRKTVQPHLFKSYWEQSLKYNGVACTPFVSAQQIFDYRVIPWKGNGDLLFDIGADALPTMTNFSIYGQLYGHCVAALFEAKDLATAKTIIAKLNRDHHEIDWSFATET